MTRSSKTALFAITATFLVAACGTDPAHTEDSAEVVRSEGTVVVVSDTILPGILTANGTAAALREATLSTKLMAAVTAVLVKEGDEVSAGALLLRLDARDLAAKAEQVAANTAAAEAMHAQAAAHAARMRALFAEGAAPKATLEAAETALAQAESGIRAARAAGAELESVSSYAEVRAPFNGQVTQRFVDPGDFAAPGAPLVTIQDASSLRITASVSPAAARALRRGQPISASIEGEPVTATIEGLVPGAGSLLEVNAIVGNGSRRHVAGSAAVLHLPAGTHRALVVPAAALIREGDLIGVIVRGESSDARRWIRIGARNGDLVVVTAGLRAGERVVLRLPRSTTSGAN